MRTIFRVHIIDLDKLAFLIRMQYKNSYPTDRVTALIVSLIRYSYPTDAQISIKCKLVV